MRQVWRGEGPTHAVGLVLEMATASVINYHRMEINCYAAGREMGEIEHLCFDGGIGFQKPRYEKVNKKKVLFARFIRK